MDAKQTPLIDLLESVPADAVMVYEHDQFHSQNIPVGRLCHEAAAALRTQIALEKQQPADEPVAWMHVQGDYEEPSLFQLDGPSMDRGWDEYPLYTRPQPVDEPVAYSVTWDDVHCGNFFFREQDAKEHKARLDTKYPGEHRKIVPLYTRPQPAAQWVGLTMEDKQEYVAQDYGGNRLDAMDWAEKRLKEKNT